MGLVAPVVTAFEKIPDLFVDRYDRAFRHWAANFQKIGERATFKLVKPLEPVALSTERRRIVGVRLKAEVERSFSGRVTRVVIRPADEENEEAIRRHTAVLAAGLQ